MKNFTYKEIVDNKFLLAALIIFIIALVFMFIMQIVVLITYIKTSWIDRRNSKNMTGGDLARKILDQEEMQDTRIVSSFFYVKYWNHSRFRKTFKLRPWTVNRSSLWTMTEAAQQTVVSTWRKKKGRMGMNFTIFRIPTILSIISVLLSILVIAYSFLTLREDASGNISHSRIIKTATIIIITFLFIGMLVSWADVVKMKIIRKHVLPILEKQGFTQEEIKKFNIIYTSRLLLAIATAIYNTILLILKISTMSKGDNKK
ncbi:zinc metallopeptidase [Mycoplasma marinum]|uniref:Uncharacterized protein n=1 Tax=Mycoplasma marinum TaxID=1937190 RepID=A0A4R0XVH5_9MOLU|nr:zinc metallopeptidase [Mycoplasma marinum]TCG11752.1 hypothetical protein C4B24_01205 [Mycoplasma marinum]